MQTEQQTVTSAAPPVKNDDGRASINRAAPALQTEQWFTDRVGSDVLATFPKGSVRTIKITDLPHAWDLYYRWQHHGYRFTDCEQRKEKTND